MLKLKPTMILAFDVDAAFDKSEWILDLINRSGVLIYKIMYVVHYLSKKYKVAGIKNIQTEDKREFYFDKMRAIRKDTEELIDGDSFNQAAAVRLLRDMQEDAKQCTQKFDLEELPMSKRFKIAFSFAGEHR